MVHKSGDAVRFGNLHGTRQEQTVITIDGGTRNRVETLVEHIKTHFGTTKVDFAFLTHPDADHASGMLEVLENLSVGTVVMHRPWDHSHAIHDLFDDGRTSPAPSAKDQRICRCLRSEKLALANNIGIIEPFAGIKTPDGSIRVPRADRKIFYRQSLARFDHAGIIRSRGKFIFNV